MKRRIILGGLAVVAMALAAFVFVIPALNPRCQSWYHRVDFIADRAVEDRHGMDLAQMEKKLGRDRMLRIYEEARTNAVEEVGTKPFYCT